MNFIKYDVRTLENNRNALRVGDPRLTAAYNRLIELANELLLATPPTVTDKTVPPPSGDKRDYTSLSRFWWPNPDTPDGLPYIRRDGVTNPAINDFDRPRMGKFTHATSVLAWAYFFSGEEKYAKKAVEFLYVWFVNQDTRMNPNMRFGQFVPGRNEGRPMGILDAYGMINVVDALRILETSNVFPEDYQRTIQAWFSEFVYWLETHPNGVGQRASRNNHGTAFDVQMAAFYRFIGRDEDAKRVIVEFPERRIFAQIEPDGRQPLELARTLAFFYSVYNLGKMLDMSEIAQNMNVNLFDAVSPDGRSIRQALDFLVPYLGQDQSHWPYQQISGWNSAQTILARLMVRADQFVSGQNYAELGNVFLSEMPIHWRTLLR